MSEVQVIKSIREAERLPAGTVVVFEHPLYKFPVAAVRAEQYDGLLVWELTGEDGVWSTHRIMDAYGWCDLTVLVKP